MTETISVLIVDDMKFVHEPVKKFLQDFVFPERNLSFTSSYNLTQAKRLLEERKYDLVMLDGEVGGSWGYEIIPEIRGHNDKVAIVSISNYSEFNIKNVKMGSDGSVNKIHLYEWNDKRGVLKKRKGKMIRELLERKNGQKEGC